MKVPLMERFEAWTLIYVFPTRIHPAILGGMMPHFSTKREAILYAKEHGFHTVNLAVAKIHYEFPKWEKIV